VIVLEPLRLRVQLTKRGRMRYLSHAEYSRTLMLAARRAGLPLQYAGMNSQRMKVSLSPPLAIGVTSECEFVDYFLSDYVSPGEAAQVLGRSLPPGIEVVSCRLMGSGAKSVGKLIDTAEYTVTLPFQAGFEGDWGKAVQEFMRKDTVNFERVQPRRTRVVNLRPGVHRLEVVGTDPEGSVRIQMVLDDGTRGTVKPSEVVQVLAESVKAPAGYREGCRVNREGLYVRRGDRLVSPLELARRRPAV